jgi:hypothetical protein
VSAQRVRVRAVPLMPALVTGAWVGFVPGLFVGGILGALITFGAGAAIEWMRELSFTTGIEQQLLPFGDRIGLLQTLQDDWPVVIPAAALAVGLFSALIGMLTAALVAASFGSLLGGVQVEVEPVATSDPKSVVQTAKKAATERPEEYPRVVGDS